MSSFAERHIEMIIEIFDLSSNTVDLKKWLGLSKQTAHLLFYNRTVDSSKLDMFAKNGIIAGTL